jgi:glyoxylase-like metal-dependent hydrolase (beta-lactamase superfamily II)
VQLNEDVYVLPLPFTRNGLTTHFNVSLIVDPENGATLVDTGVPGQMGVIASALAEANLAVADLKRIILTHQDIDHVGSLRQLVDASGAQVLAHEVESPYIDGTELARFQRPEALAATPELRAIVERMRPTAIDQVLRDGTRLDLAGGVRVVFTPGHTPGHTCLYLERSKTIIAGDALTASEGRLAGPSVTATQDMATAMDSVRRLAELDVEAIVCYHGGAITEDAAGQLRQVASEPS